MNRVVALGAISALMVFSLARECIASVEQGKNMGSVSVRILTREGPRNLVCGVNKDGSTKFVVVR